MSAEKRKQIFSANVVFANDSNHFIILSNYSVVPSNQSYSQTQIRPSVLCTFYLRLVSQNNFCNASVKKVYRWHYNSTKKIRSHRLDGAATVCTYTVILVKLSSLLDSFSRIKSGINLGINGINIVIINKYDWDIRYLLLVIPPTELENEVMEDFGIHRWKGEKSN